MNKRLLLVILFLLIIFSVLFFTGYLQKFELIGPKTWYFRNDLTLSTSPTDSETYVKTVRPSSDNITFCVEFKAGNRLLLDHEIIELPPQYGIYGSVDISFSSSVYPNEDVKILLYFKDITERRFLQVQFNSNILSANSFSVKGRLWYRIDSGLDKGIETVYIYYGSSYYYITGVSYNVVPPTANFSYNPESPSIIDNILFDASNSIGAITSYTWNFYEPNGTLYRNITENAPYFNITLSIVGSWTVKLTVTDIYSQTGETIKTVNVSAYPLSIDFSWSPENPEDYDVVTFVAFYYAKYGVKSITWSFGDGSTGSGASVVHTYVKNGTYNVMVIITDNNNMQISTSKKVTVSYYIITVNFIYSPLNPTINEIITFSANYSSKYAVTSIVWDFGDGSTGLNSPITHSYLNSGVYLVNVTITDVNNKQASKNQQVSVKLKLEIVSETQLTQTYDLSGEVDFNAVFRVKVGNSYTSDFNIANLTLIDEKTGNSIPYESYKEDYSIYVKAYLFKYYGTADDRNIRLSLELSSNTYLGISYSLTVKMTKPTIVVYMTDSSGQLIKSFVTGTNTFYLKFEAKGLNVNPSDVNITVINPEGVKSSISSYDIVPAGTNIVKVTYTFEKTGTYVFVIELHGVVEMQPKTFTYSVNEPYNFFRYDNPFFVAVVIIAILIVYSLVKRKRNV